DRVHWSTPQSARILPLGFLPPDLQTKGAAKQGCNGLLALGMTRPWHSDRKVILLGGQGGTAIQQRFPAVEQRENGGLNRRILTRSVRAVRRSLPTIKPVSCRTRAGTAEGNLKHRLCARSALNTIPRITLSGRFGRK